MGYGSTFSETGKMKMDRHDEMLCLSSKVPLPRSSVSHKKFRG